MLTKRRDYSEPHSYPVTSLRTRYVSPVFGLRRRIIDMGDAHERRTLEEELTRDYHMALFKATIEAAGAKTMEISDTSLRDRLYEYPYVRDPVVVLHDQQLIITTHDNRIYGSGDIIREVEQATHYKKLVIDKAYFEGGNVFYFPSQKILFHGINPGGHYNESFHQPIDTNIQLSRALKPYGIRVQGLMVSSDFKRRLGNYYHLDCFMQHLPDGRLVILNKKILSKLSQMKLEKIFKEKLIDLAFPEYIANPVMFNFITIPKEKSVIIAPTMPRKVIAALTKLHFTVVTPDCLDYRRSRYNMKLAEKVVTFLHKEGYVGATQTNLASHLPINKFGYLLKNTDRFFVNFKNFKNGFTQKWVDEYYKRQSISFVYGYGGPHCFTLEIVPPKCIIEMDIPIKKEKRSRLSCAMCSLFRQGEEEKKDREVEVNHYRM